MRAAVPPQCCGATMRAIPAQSSGVTSRSWPIWTHPPTRCSRCCIPPFASPSARTCSTHAAPVCGRDEVVAGFVTGKRLLATQTIDILELLVAGERVAVRATWRGTIGEGTDALAAGTELAAHIAAWLTVTDG